MPRPAHHSHNAEKPKQLPPSKDHAAAPSPTSHRQASGDTSATPALCPLTVIILGGCLFRRRLLRTAHSQRKRTYQMVSFFSCGPNRGLAWARMAMSQLQRDPTCRQPRQHRGRDQDPGMLLPQGAGRGTAAPGGEVPGREGGRQAAARGLSHSSTGRRLGSSHWAR